ncbi:low specificity L-threonine aldolase [Ensifer sp. YR511]|uniref:threonine aldolase family protein n=1 Tax=Ensifer sp. YR511 TaxID=1855294 RepID=UPI0008821804|nr:beta-eliminating lyase-related protein [Ensifer sp. YR511]SDN75896.1 L-threonine aldolase [Ensifer sp. YR511]
MTHDFLSDNTSGILPQVAVALANVAMERTPPYGNDGHTKSLDQLFSRHFEKEVAVVLTSSGTAANSLALSVIAHPFEAILCHEHSHIQLREAGAPEFFTQGAKLVPLGGVSGKIDDGELAREFERGKSGRGQMLRYAAVSVTQPSDFGSLYDCDELKRICQIAHSNNAVVHMDGARFPQAVASLATSPADLTWRAGIDVLTFGGTKTGGFAAEAIVLFDPSLLPKAKLLQKRSGQTLSKMRFLSCQWPALLENDVIYEAARHARAQARNLADGLVELGLEITHAVEINMVFASLPISLVDYLRAAGVSFLTTDAASESMTARFVTSFETSAQELEALLDLVRTWQT